MGQTRRQIQNMSKICMLGLLLLNFIVITQCNTTEENAVTRLDNEDTTHNAENETAHDNSSHDNDSHHGNHSHKGEHIGIHVASLQLEYVKTYLFVATFLIVAAICKLGFHKAEVLSSIVPESCLLILLGTVVGGILSACGYGLAQLHLSPGIFFLILLPPIILESAYSLHDRVFFDNLGTILLYAVMGTIINCFILALSLWGLAEGGAMGNFSVPLSLLQCLVFSSLIVAVDPVAVLAIFQEVGVNNVLYFLVFGESLLNDAVTVVLYNTMKTFNKMDTIPATQVVLGFVAFFTVSLGGLSIGIIFGIFSSFLTKYTNNVKVVEPLAVFTLAYASYLTAELFHFSGIISIIGCGLLQVQYAFHNISARSLTTITYFSKTMSTTCDCIIFMFLGLALVRTNHEWHTGFILWTLFLCLALRFIVVYFLTFLANKLNRVRKIDKEEQFIMAYGGLRGAVAFSLAVMLDSEMAHKDMFVTATLAVIIFTVFFQGISIKPLVKLLRIKQSEKKVISMYQEISSHVTDHMMAGVEEIAGRYGHNVIRELFSQYDNKYLKHWLQRCPETRDEAIMHLYNKMAMQLHYENLHLGGVPDISQSFDNGSQFELYPCPPSPKAKEAPKMHSCENAPRKPSLQDSRKPSLIPLDKLRQLTEAAADESQFGDFMTGEPGAEESMLDKKRKRGLSIPQPSIRRRNPRAFSEESQDRPMSMDEEAIRIQKRRSTLFDIFNRSVDNSNQDIKVNDLHNIFLKNRQNYRQRHDKNLKQDEKNDLLHLLYEKRKRTARLRRASMIGLSPAESMVGDRDLTKHYLSEPNSPRRHTTLDMIKEGEVFDFKEPDGTTANNNSQRADDPIVEIIRPTKAAVSENAPLLEKLTSGDSVFSSGDKNTSDRPKSEVSNKPSTRRHHLVRQNDIRGRSESPPSTPPTGGERNTRQDANKSAHENETAGGDETEL